MPHGQRCKQVVCEAFFQRTMRDRHIVPVLFRVQLMEIERLQERQGQQGATETQMLFLRKDFALLTFSV